MRLTQSDTRLRHYHVKAGRPVAAGEHASELALLDADVEVATGAGQEQPHRVSYPDVPAFAHGLAGPGVVLVVQLIEQCDVQISLAGEVMIKAADARARQRHDVGNACLRIALAA